MWTGWGRRLVKAQWADSVVMDPWEGTKVELTGRINKKPRTTLVLTKETNQSQKCLLTGNGYRHMELGGRVHD